MHLKYRLSNEELKVARLRGNFSSTLFHIFDDGKNPRDLRPGQRLHPSERLRRQYGTILYQAEDRKGKKVGRHMEVYVPHVPEEAGSQQIIGWPDTVRKKSHIYKEFQEQIASGADFKTDKDYHLYEENDKPEELKLLTPFMDMYHSIEDASVLSFDGGIVAKPSRKNFQLVDNEKPQTGEPNPEDVQLQFGRINDDVFHMQVKYPLSLVQAFAICLSAFEYNV